jgi:hypothetical protein
MHMFQTLVVLEKCVTHAMGELKCKQFECTSLDSESPGYVVLYRLAKKLISLEVHVGKVNNCMFKVRDCNQQHKQYNCSIDLRNM